jgi:hypothetical protein
LIHTEIIKLLNFGVIFRKRINSFNGSRELVDLTDSTLNTRLQVTIENVIIVSKAFAGKPTAIAYSLYGSENFADLLFFFNGYSNMFRVNEGDVLVVPNIDSMISCLNDPEDITSVAETKSRSEDNFTQTEFKKKIINRDINRLKVISENTGIDITKLDIRKPNIATGESFTKEDNSIIIGTNISETKCKTLTASQTKSDLIRDAVKNQLISKYANDQASYKGILSFNDKTAQLT